jgi:hypothetical protein
MFRQTMKKPHPIVCFGFGGKFITMFPRPKFKDILENPIRNESLKSLGPVNVHKLSNLLSNSSFVSSLAEFPGPLTSKVKQVQILFSIFRFFLINYWFV